MKPPAFTLFLALFASGCSKLVDPHMYGPTAAPPGRINHVVFFDLKDPGDVPQLIADCRRLLETKVVTSGYVGTHYDIGRSSVLRDYDVGFFVAFNSEDDYRAYVEDPAHAALVEKWKPRWDSIRVYDIEDQRWMGRRNQ